MGIKVVAFDFDGVIADTTQLKSQLFLKLFEGHSEYDSILAYEKRFQSSPRRMKLEEILGKIIKINVPNNIDKYLDKYAEDLELYLPKAPQINGFQGFIRYLENHQIPSYIVSSGQEAEILRYLQKMASNPFKKIFDAKIVKPTALEKIISDHSILRSELLFLGDSLTDYDAAQEVSCAFVAINPHRDFPEDVVCFKDFSAFDLRLLL